MLNLVSNQRKNLRKTYKIRNARMAIGRKKRTITKKAICKLSSAKTDEQTYYNLFKNYGTKNDPHDFYPTGKIPS